MSLLFLLVAGLQSKVTSFSQYDLLLTIHLPYNISTHHHSQYPHNTAIPTNLPFTSFNGDLSMLGQTLAPLGGVSLDFVNMRGVLELNEVNAINTTSNNTTIHPPIHHNTSQPSTSHPTPPDQPTLTTTGGSGCAGAGRGRIHRIERIASTQRAVVPIRPR